MIVVNLIADDTYSSKVSPIRKFNDQCKLFLAVMQGARLAKRQFPSKKTKGEISASLREFFFQIRGPGKRYSSARHLGIGCRKRLPMPSENCWGGCSCPSGGLYVSVVSVESQSQHCDEP